MSKYEELRSAVSTLVASETQYWDKLSWAYGQIQDKLKEYLGLTNETVVDTDGKKKPVVQVGKYNEEEKRVHTLAFWELPREGRKVCFDIFLRIPTTDSFDVQIKKKIATKVSCDGGEFYFEAEGLPSIITCHTQSNTIDMIPFFDAVYLELQTKLVPNKS